MSSRWTDEQYQAYIARNNRAAVRAPDLERAAPAPGEGQDKANEVHPRVRIEVHSRRRRLADPDGVSAKAVIDGLREGGLLVDDSLEYVESVSFSQEKSRTEETMIEIWEIRDK